MLRRHLVGFGAAAFLASACNRGPAAPRTYLERAFASGEWQGIASTCTDGAEVPDAVAVVDVRTTNDPDCDTALQVRAVLHPLVGDPDDSWGLPWSVCVNEVSGWTYGLTPLPGADDPGAEGTLLIRTEVTDWQETLWALAHGRLSQQDGPCLDLSLKTVAVAPEEGAQE